MRQVTIYKITGPDGVYVGQTVQALSARFSQHVYKSTGESECGKLREAISKHGRGAFKIEAIELVDERSALDREAYWIDRLSSFSSGYNSSVGGAGPNGMRVKDSVRETHSKNTKARWKSREWIEKRRRGLEKNPTYRASQSKKGLLGAAARVAGQVWFQVVDKKTRTSIGRWQNGAECARVIGVDQTTVQRCVKGVREHARYIFIQEFDY